MALGRPGGEAVTTLAVCLERTDSHPFISRAWSAPSPVAIVHCPDAILPATIPKQPLTMAQPQPSAPKTVLQRFWDLDVRRPAPGPSYPPIASIPRSSAARLAEATPDACPAVPIPSLSRGPGADATGAGTVLYLAYGSNLAAETFLGRRGIRPLSRVNVSAPSLRLTFDLPCLPYREPCFANTALRKLPDKPEMPPGLPDPPVPVPDLPPSAPGLPPHPAVAGPPGGDGGGDGGGDDASARRTLAHGDPVWPHGLVGVVYEVTRADFAHILATEGGGASYTDILVPCFALPAPRVGLPERPPPAPGIPRPFLAHTLFAPQLSSGGDDGLGADCGRPDLPAWARRLLRPARRPDPEYAQPSARYLKLLTDGAREHELPADYQAYLGGLAPYTVTSARQRWGMALLGLMWAPMLLLVMGTSRLLSDGKGRAPLWLALGIGAVFNLMWMSYDHLFRPVFGDGERTEDSGGETAEKEPLLFYT